MVGGQSKWSTEWKADVWYNIAYEIDFTGGNVSFWYSTGSDPLKLTKGPFKASTRSVSFCCLRENSVLTGVS
jgi:hypothetical protein